MARASACANDVFPEPGRPPTTTSNGRDNPAVSTMTGRHPEAAPTEISWIWRVRNDDSCILEMAVRAVSIHASHAGMCKRDPTAGNLLSVAGAYPAGNV